MTKNFNIFKYDSFEKNVFQSNKKIIIISKFKLDLHIKVNFLLINVKPTGLFLL